MSVRSARVGLRPVAVLAGATMALVLVPASSPSATWAGAAGPQAVPAVAFDPAGFFGGAVTGVAVDGNHAYVSRGLRLEVFDVSDPAAPRIVGGSGLLPGMAKATASRHGVVYLVERVRGAAVDELDRLYVIDASRPSAPELRGSLELPKGTLADMAVGAGFLYTAAEGLGVMVLDISDPERPHVVGAVGVDERVNGVAVADAGLLVAVGGTHDGGLRVLSLEDPMRPRPVGSLEVADGGGRAVAAVGDFALLATWDRVVVVDVRDPTAPRAEAQTPTVYDARAIAVAGRRAFVLRAPVAVRDTHHLTALDISRLPAIEATGDIAVMPGLALAAAGDAALVAEGRRGLLVVAPGEGGEGLVEIFRAPTIGDPGGIVIEGGRAYVADGDGELWVLDAAAARTPRSVGRTDLLTQRTPGRAAVAYGTPGLAVRGGHAFVARAPYGATPGGIHVVDVADPGRPAQVGYWDSWVDYGKYPAVDGRAVANGYPPALMGDRLFTTGDPLLVALDISDARAPGYVASYPLVYPPNWGPAWPKPGGVAVKGDRAWVAEPYTGLHMLDLSRPATIEQLGVLKTLGRPSDVALVGERLLVADGPWGLLVVDAPTLQPVGGIQGIDAQRLAVSGNTAYVTGYTVPAAASGSMHLWSIDVSDASHPMIGADYSLRYFSIDAPPAVAVAGGIMYVSAGAAGLEIVTVGGEAPLPPRERLFLPRLHR